MGQAKVTFSLWQLKEWIDDHFIICNDESQSTFFFYCLAIEQNQSLEGKPRRSQAPMGGLLLAEARWHGTPVRIPTPHLLPPAWDHKTHAAFMLLKNTESTMGTLQRLAGLLYGILYLELDCGHISYLLLCNQLPPQLGGFKRYTFL